MSFIEQYQNQKQRNGVTHLTTEIVKWDTPGMEIVGKLVSVEQFEDGEYDDECMKYLIDTDDGLKSIVLGPSRDKLLSSYLTPGIGYYIRFNGKKVGNNKRTFNDFTIDIFEVKR